MIIIVEGVDGVGKTTIAKELSEQLRLFYIKESYIDNEYAKKTRVVDVLENILLDNNVIYDRTTLIDDIVYNFLNNKESDLSKYIDVIDTLLSHCILVHLELDEDIRKERFDKRGDEYITNDMIEKISENYNKLYDMFEKAHIYKIRLSGYLHVDIHKIIETIKNDKNFTHSAC